MTAYLFVKWLHVISATILFGTGLGTALHLWLTHRQGNVQAIAVATRNTVLVDWLFTATSGIVQPLTGMILVYLAGYDPFSPWLLWSYVLYTLAFACWAPVVWLQIRIRDMAAQAAAKSQNLPANYYRYMKYWFLLGWPAFISLLLIFYLMISRTTPPIP